MTLEMYEEKLAEVYHFQTHQHKQGIETIARTECVQFHPHCIKYEYDNYESNRPHGLTST